LTLYTNLQMQYEYDYIILHRGADKPLARPGRKQATATKL